jgi:hypothetical protein
VGGSPVIAVINEQFLKQSDGKVDYQSEKAVGIFNKQDRKEVIELFGNLVQPVNTTSIAKVCLTDHNTVDQMLAEFVS